MSMNQYDKDFYISMAGVTVVAFIGFVWLFHVFANHQELRDECAAKGGVLIEMQCVAKEAIIK